MRIKVFMLEKGTSNDFNWFILSNTSENPTFKALKPLLNQLLTIHHDIGGPMQDFHLFPTS